MKNTILVSFLLTFVCSVSAQVSSGPHRHYLEVGVMAGIFNYSGDLSERHIEWRQSRPAYGIFSRYHLSQSFILKAQAVSGQIYADDKYSTGHRDRKFRVSGPVHELSLVLEYAPLHFGFENSEGKQYYFFPYVFGGIGGAYAKTKLEYYGSPEDMANYIREPLPEGGKEQRSFICMPIGGGLRFNLDRRMTLGLEGGLRPVFSDLLDGVSKNGNPAFNDWYYFVGFTASYYLGHPWQIKE